MAKDEEKFRPPLVFHDANNHFTPLEFFQSFLQPVSQGSVPSIFKKVRRHWRVVKINK